MVKSGFAYRQTFFFIWSECFEETMIYFIYVFALSFKQTFNRLSDFQTDFQQTFKLESQTL